MIGQEVRFSRWAAGRSNGEGRRSARERPHLRVLPPVRAGGEDLGPQIAKSKRWSSGRRGWSNLEFAWHGLRILAFIAGCGITAGAAFTVGAMLVCKLTGWAPVSITVNNFGLRAERGE